MNKISNTKTENAGSKTNSRLEDYHQRMVAAHITSHTGHCVIVSYRNFKLSELLSQSGQSYRFRGCCCYSFEGDNIQCPRRDWLDKKKKKTEGPSHCGGCAQKKQQQQRNGQLVGVKRQADKTFVCV